MPETKKLDISPSFAILAAGALIAGAILYVHFHPTPTVAAEAQPTATVSVSPASASEHIVGDPKAPIVLIEYSDFQCPFCSMVYPTLKKIVNESGGKIAWVYRNFPLESIHPQAKPAAIASECITEQLGNDGFWKFADIVFNNQKSISPPFYAAIAKQLGADMTKYNTCITSEEPYARIQAQANEAQANGGQGTPYTIVVGNGAQVPVSGAVPYDQFMSVIKAVQARH